MCFHIFRPYPIFHLFHPVFTCSVFVLLWLHVNASLFPQGHQWNYSYYALLRSGSLLPSEAYSQWDLRALLTITAVDNVVVAQVQTISSKYLAPRVNMFICFQLSNFNTSLYNGQRDGIPQNLQPAPIPTEAAALGTPFLINYVGTQVETITVNENDRSI